MAVIGCYGGTEPPRGRRLFCLKDATQAVMWGPGSEDPGRIGPRTYTRLTSQLVPPAAGM